MISIEKLLKACEIFLKYAALEFGEEEKWIPDEFKKLHPFKNFPYSKVEKVFESFGIKDFVVPLKDIDFNMSEHIQEILKKVENALNVIRNYRNYPVLAIEDTKTFEKTIYLADKLALYLSNNLDRNKESIRLKEEIKVDNEIYPRGTNIIQLYHDIIKTIKKIAPNINIGNPVVRFDDYKAFEKRDKIFLVFSTKISDLAGISSRGLESCQSLFKDQCVQINENSQQLVGTVLSKYIGVCYITTKSNYKDRGWKMIARSLVRQVVDTKTFKPLIYIDKMYPFHNEQLIKIMQEELQKKSSIPVVTENKSYFSPEYEEEHISEDYRSYHDSDLKNYNVYLKMRNSERDIIDRIKAAEKLKPEDLIPLIDDPEPEVRIAVAKRIDEQYLEKMINDSDPDVRLAVLNRLPKNKWHLMIHKNQFSTVIFWMVQNIPTNMLDLFNNKQFVYLNNTDKEYLESIINRRKSGTFYNESIIF